MKSHSHGMVYWIKTKEASPCFSVCTKIKPDCEDVFIELKGPWVCSLRSAISVTTSRLGNSNDCFKILDRAQEFS